MSAYDPTQVAGIGNSNLSVTQVGFGGGALGDAWDVISEQQAQDTLRFAYDEGMRYFDTAPWYGNTLSEHRIGHFLRQCPRDSYVLSTKVGRVYSRDKANEGKAFYPRWQGGLKFKLRFDYTRAGVLRSYEDSLQRMGLNAVDSLVIHDLDLRHQQDEAGIDKAFSQLEKEGGFAALQALKDAGEIKVIGAGINHIGMIPRFVERFDIDYFLLAMPYTLIDQSALDSELPLCEKNNIGIVIGAVFGSGILATGTSGSANAGTAKTKPATANLNKANKVKYGYKDAEPELVQRVQAMEHLCRQFDVELPSAALQFVLAHPAVNAVIPGCNSPAQVKANMDSVRCNIPGDFWLAMKDSGLIRADAPVPTDDGDVSKTVKGSGVNRPE